ncbi:MAG: molybdopterin-dependent oxidoreductase [Chloroflexi bacterium]|nr:molybdopterin-dependent oxidoreductase [Chloroflexota bacterium]
MARHRLVALVTAAVTAAGMLLLPARAQTLDADYSPELTVQGLVAEPRTYTLEALRALPASEVWFQAVNELMPRMYRGVTLYDLLMDAGPLFDPARPTDPLNWYVVVSAGEGRSAVVAWGEIHPWFEEKPVLVAYERDGQPLPPQMGMARLVVPFDRQATRGIANIRTVSLQRAELTPATVVPAPELPAPPRPEPSPATTEAVRSPARRAAVHG